MRGATMASGRQIADENVKTFSLWVASKTDEDYRATYKAYDTAGVCIVQMAVAGRAEKRMYEATGRSASTIATFLRTHKEDLALPTVLVIDEASMLDIISMSRICE